MRTTWKTGLAATALGTAVLAVGLLAPAFAQDPSGAKGEVAPAAAAPAAPADDREPLVRKILDITGASKMGMQVMNAMMERSKQDPNLPPGFGEKFVAMAKPEDMTNLIGQIYLKHLDRETLEAMLKFYESPAGRKMIEKQPVIMQESMAAGQRWGQELAMKVLSELKAEHDKTDGGEELLGGDDAAKK
ncbi:MAG: DUF2059 domain-containing protein [Planctomycetes bacterium]|nr:DUF2059 domain-containing protein [Planctomycetota bacterium]